MPSLAILGWDLYLLLSAGSGLICHLAASVLNVIVISLRCVPALFWILYFSMSVCSVASSSIVTALYVSSPLLSGCTGKCVRLSRPLVGF